MSLRFVVGRAGSGKSRHCREAIWADLRRGPYGPPLLLLVPEQAAFSTLAELLAPPDGPEALGRAEVISFRRLTRMVHADLGRPPTPAISESARLAVLTDLLRQRQSQLSVFASTADRPGFAAAVAAALTELNHYRVEPSDLRARLRALAPETEPARPVPSGSLSGTQPSPPSDPLAAKLADLLTVVESYREFLTGRFVDTEQELTDVADRLADWGRLRGARLWVDGFTGFTPQEQAVLAQLFRLVAATEVTLSLDPYDPEIDRPPRPPRRGQLPPPERTDAFAPTAETYQTLWRLAAEVGRRPQPTLRLRGRPVLRFLGSPELGHIEAEWTARQPRIFEGDPADLTVAAADDPDAEVAAMAAELIRLVRDRGYRYRECGVLLRDLGGYADRVARAFEQRGVPFFLDRRRPMAGHPLMLLVRSVLGLMAAWESAQAAASTAVVGTGTASPSPRRSESAEWLTVLRSPLLGLPVEDTDRLERALTLGQVSVADWLSDDPVAEPARDADGFDAVAAGRAAVRGLRDLAAATFGGGFGFGGVNAVGGVTVRRAAAGLWALLEHHAVPARLAEWAEAAATAGRPGDADAHRQAAPLLADWLDQIVESLGDRPLIQVPGRDVRSAETARPFGSGPFPPLNRTSRPETSMSWSELRERLAPALAELTLGQVPPACDAVTVGDLERSRYPHLRAGFLLGVGEGLFPRPTSEDAVLDDSDRRRLAEAGTELAPTAERALLSEESLAYRALTLSARRLWVSWPRRDADGRPINPSRLVDRLRRLFPDLRVRSLRAQPTSAGEVGTLDGLAAALNAFDRTGDPTAALAEPEAEPTLLPVGEPRPDDPARIARVMGPLWAAERALSADAVWGPALLRRRGSLLVSPNTGAGLSAELVAAFFGTGLTAEVAQLERFASCPFRHFAEYVLRPGPFGVGRRESLTRDAVGRGGGGRFGAGSFDLVAFQRTALERFLARLVEVARSPTGTEPPAQPSQPDPVAAAARTAMDAAVMEAMLEALPAASGLSARQRFLLERSREQLRQIGEVLAERLRTEPLVPRAAAVRFGPDPRDRLPGLVVPLAGGRELIVAGQLGRVDAVAGGTGELLAAVRDTPGSARAFELTRLYHGLSLRPAVQLLVLRAMGLAGGDLLGQRPSGSEPTGPASPSGPITVRPIGVVSPGLTVPAAPISYPPIPRPGEARSTEPRPAEARSTESRPAAGPEAATARQRGLLVEEFLGLLDPAFRASAGASGYRSSAYRFRLDRSARPVDRGRTDVLSAAELDALLASVQARLAELAERLLAGDTRVQPYRLGSESPCGSCRSRAVCRFDPDLHLPRRLEDLDRLTVLARLSAP